VAGYAFTIHLRFFRSENASFAGSRNDRFCTRPVTDVTPQNERFARECAMTTQLRIYTIHRGSLRAWVSEWREKIKPLRQRLGFTVLGAWTHEETSRFFWILQYSGRQSWDALETAFHGSEERRSMQPNPARHIAKAEHFFVSDVPE
jgi:hypothetical protein